MANPDDAASFKLQDCAFNALDEYFKAHEDEVVEIEILPPGIHQASDILMQEGLNVGIPRQILILGYVKAKRIFLETFNTVHHSELALEASKIMLLMDPEHLTAANFRKRWLLRLKKETQEKAQKELAKAITREIIFLNSILTSPLHRQSKSPTLWHHRAWLLDFSFPVRLTDSSQDQFLPFVRAELDAVFKAGEQHSKNYYAWQYARRLVTTVDHLFQTEPHKPWKDSYHAFLVTCALLVKAWCLKHTSDISGWSFLLFLLPRLKSIARRRRIVKQVLGFAIDLRSEQESLWVFLRTALGDTVLEDEREKLVQQLRDYQNEKVPVVSDNDVGSTAESHVTQAVKWVDMYMKPLPELRSPQPPNAEHTRSSSNISTT
ncbi:hypothetical protein K469DRAFT_575614 [Zopfia rhizophila CBS 207.26]|uniref:Protein prenylyltransferase n=1 Tax=Zopfia rhizophila CBS 207.26 TaxID=1314779 RepID=A0A6A6E391_9PEZI|nr:hypothetical protein K469DRAFT_575614 [Zopfia rhizophila CBS 207.26]